METSYEQRYRKTARYFEIIGGVVLAAGVLMNQFLILVVGVLIFGYGFGSLQPHNQIKAFAQQCTIDPSREMAQGLLSSLQRVKKVRLTASSIRLLQSAVEAYAQSPDADLQIVQQLRDAVETRVGRRIL